MKDSQANHNVKGAVREGRLVAVSDEKANRAGRSALANSGARPGDSNFRDIESRDIGARAIQKQMGCRCLFPTALIQSHLTYRTDVLLDIGRPRVLGFSLV